MNNKTVLALVAIILFVYTLALRQCAFQRPADVYKTDTLVIHDTVRVTQVKPVKSYFVKYDTVRLKVTPDYATVLTEAETLDSGQANMEILPLLIPLRRQEYKTDSFRAVITGYNVKLDTLELYRQERIITAQKKPPRFVLSVGVGVGRDFKPTPNISVGYVLFSR